MAMWLGFKFSSPNTNFNLAEAIDIDRALDPALFAAAMQQVANEVEATSLSFVDTAHGPRQVVAPTFTGELPYLDFSAEGDPCCDGSLDAWRFAATSTSHTNSGGCPR